MSVRYRVLVPGLVVLAALGACGRGGSQSSQVVARVNDRDITVSQLNQVLLASGTASTDPDAVKAALDSLVDEELMVQKALENKLDRDPGVMQAIERARRQILARAYAERDVARTGEIEDTEKRRYYDAHPALFAKRRIYHLSVFAIAPQQVNDALKDEIGKTQSAQQVQELLTRNKVSYELQKTSMAAEQLPLQVLPAFAEAQVGDIFNAPQADGRTLVMALTGLDDSPLTLEQARPTITQYLMTTRMRAMADTHVKEAKAGAAISYLGTAATLHP